MGNFMNIHSNKMISIVYAKTYMLGDNGVDLQLVLLDLGQNIFSWKRGELGYTIVLLRCREIVCGVQLIHGVPGALSWSRNIIGEAAVGVHGSFGLD